MITLALALHGLALPQAHAQGFDTQGPALPPQGADVRDPALGLGGGETGAPMVTILGHSAGDNLVERLAQGPNIDDTKIVGGMFGASLSGRMGIYGPVGIGLTIPTWFFSLGNEGGGPSLGDMTLWVPVEIFSLEQGHRVGVVPFLNLPTGADARYLGEPGTSGGLLATGRVALGRFFTHADLGFDVVPETGIDQWPGGPHYRFALDGGYAPTDRWAAHLELRGRGPFSSNAPSLPSEVMGTFKFHPSERVWLTAAAGTALTRGPGASALRALFGVTVAPGSKPVDAEIVSAPPPREVHVIDERRFPIHGATVVAGGVTSESDHEGFAYLPPRSVRDGVVVVTHPHYETLELNIDPSLPFWEAKLIRKPVPVAVSVVGPQGSLMMVEVEVDGPYDAGPARVDEAGVHHWDLEPGSWFVRMASPGLGTQERTLVIQKERTEPIRVDAVLTSGVELANRVRVEVVDRFGRPVEDAVVALEDRDLGTTGTGGDVIVLGVESGEGTLTIRSDKFGDKAKLDVIIDEEGDQIIQAVVDWRPGSVQVQATSPSGEPVNATVNFLGPANLPPRATGSDGTELFVLRPGLWDVEVSAPGLGTQIRTIEVTEKSGEVVVVDVDMTADEGGPSMVKLVVRDVDGETVEGAEVALDGKVLGKTGPRGDVAIAGLKEGERTFTITGEGIVDGKKTVELVAGEQNAVATVKWKPGVLDVAAVDVEGQPVAASITVKGAGRSKAEIQLGTDGEDRVVLGPGEYTVVAQAEGYAKQERTVVLEEGDSSLGALSFKLAPQGEVADVAVKVVGPDGKPIDEASVSFDGQIVGEVVSGQLVTTGVSAGPILVGVQAEGMRPASVGAAVMLKQENVVEVPLEWAPGAMEVAVTGPDGKPVEATVTVRAKDGSAGLDPRVVTDGDEVIGLRPGTWQMVVEAEGMRTQVVDLELPDESVLTQVPVKMEARPEGKTAVVVKAETERGAAVADAEVRVNGEVVGRTTSAGTFELIELPDDEDVVVTVTPTDGYHDAIEIPIDMAAVAQRKQSEVQAAVVVQESAQDIAVLVENVDGEQVAAKVIAVRGADTMDEVDLGDRKDDGILSLRPGVYTITAQTENGEVATTDIVVPERDPRTGGLPDQATYIMGADEQGMSPDGVATVLVSPQGMAMLSLRVEQISAAVSEGVVVPVNPILFDTGQHALREDALPLARDLARWLTAHREAALVEIGGHTDDIGGVVYNQALAERRAHTVMQALIDFGVSPERLRARGYGLSRPVTANVDAPSRQRNRRVALTVLDWVEE